MLAKHTSPTPSRQRTALASTRLSHTALGPGGRGAEVPVDADESPFEAIACGLLAVAFVILCFGIAAMGVLR